LGLSEIAMPNIPLSLTFATLTSKTVPLTVPFLISFTFPVFFSKTRMSSGARKLIPVGNLNPEAYS
jgi:hypothetical protein